MNRLRIEDGDLYLPAAATKFQVLGEPQSTLQALRDAFSLAVGDWFLDKSAGVDREVMVGKLSSVIPPAVEIRRVLARVPSVTSVLRVEVRRLESRADAEAVGVEDRWDEAPGRLLYAVGQVTSTTTGVLDFGLSVSLPTVGT